MRKRRVASAESRGEAAGADRRWQQAHDRLKQAAARLEALRQPGHGEAASRLDVTPGEDGLAVFWLLNEDALFVPEEGEPIFSEIMRHLGSSQVAPFLASRPW